MLFMYGKVQQITSHSYLSIAKRFSGIHSLIKDMDQMPVKTYNINTPAYKKVISKEEGLKIKYNSGYMECRGKFTRQIARLQRLVEEIRINKDLEELYDKFYKLEEIIEKLEIGVTLEESENFINEAFSTNTEIYEESKYIDDILPRKINFLEILERLEKLDKKIKRLENKYSKKSKEEKDKNSKRSMTQRERSEMLVGTNSTEEYYYLYVIELDYGLVKIGISNDTERRFREIQNAGGGEVIEAHRLNYFKKDIALSYEGYLHEVFDDFRKNGEFFELDMEEV